MKKTKPNIEASIDLPQVDDEALATLAAFAHAAGDSNEPLDSAIGDDLAENAGSEEEDAEASAFDLTAFGLVEEEDETPDTNEPGGLKALELNLPVLSAADFVLPTFETEGEEAGLGDEEEDDQEAEDGEDADFSSAAERALASFAHALPSDEDDDALAFSADDDEDAEKTPATASGPELILAEAVDEDDDDGAEEEDSEDVDPLDIDALALAPFDPALMAGDDDALAFSTDDDENDEEEAGEPPEIAFDPAMAFAGTVESDEEDAIDLDAVVAAQPGSTDDDAEDAEGALSILEQDTEELHDFSEGITIQDKDLDQDSESDPSHVDPDLPIALEALGASDEAPDGGESAIGLALDALDASASKDDEDVSEEAEDEAGDAAGLEQDEETAETIGAAFAEIDDEGETPDSRDFAAFAPPRQSARRSNLANHCSADRHLGLWAAEKLGHRGEDAQETYARSVVLAGIITADASGGLEQVIADLASLGIHPETVRTRYDLILTSLGHDGETQGHGAGGYDVFTAP